MAARFQAFRIGNQEIVLQANRRGAAPTHWKEFNHDIVYQGFD